MKEKGPPPPSKVGEIKFIEGIPDLQAERYNLRTGHNRHYRGKHRSGNKGAGIKAFFRSVWMKRYHS